MASQTPRLAALQTPTLHDQLSRWWSRRYGRPPNDPLFTSETQTFWMTEFYRDCLDEAYTLKDQIEQVPQGSSSNKAAAALKSRLLARFRALQAILKGDSASPQDDRMAQDIEASRRGEVPDFIRRKMARQEAGDAPMAKDPVDPDRGTMPPMMRQKLQRQNKPSGQN